MRQTCGERADREIRTGDEVRRSVAVGEKGIGQVAADSVELRDDLRSPVARDRA